MVVTGRIRRRLALAIVLTALIPVLVAVLMAQAMIRQSSERFFQPEFAARLDQSLGVYQELARAMKASMRNAATAIAERESLRRAAADGDRAGVQRTLEELFGTYPELVILTVQDADGVALGSVDRGKPLDPDKENQLEVIRSLGADDAGDAPQLVAVFAADRARFDERDEMSRFVEQYKTLQNIRGEVDTSYLQAFALLLGITIIAAVGVGTLLARGVSSRLGHLAGATRRVGAGDLSVRVSEDGADEITDLSRAFNTMLGEVEASRARIEYLQRIGAWQEMARRLAHEIKNPLTPIQLVVQELHRRYGGGDEAYKKLVDTTLEIVEDEVATLRRLVGEFSDFARLPQAKLERGDLAEFLEQQAERGRVIDEDATDDPGGGVGLQNVRPRFELPVRPAPLYMDREMLRRALSNLVRNSAQAIEGSARSSGEVVVTAVRDGEFWQIDVDDDGPGIPDELTETLFDPYVTTKTYGTGLGLAIVKKIIVEHGGTIVALDRPGGGARIRIRLPAADTAASNAALEARNWRGPPSSSRSRSMAPNPADVETAEPPASTEG